MKIITILGTRPEITKLSSLIPELCTNHENIIIHTGQHYDHNMDSIFFEELNLPKPNYNLEVGSHPQGKQTALMLEKIEKIIIKEKPDIIIVQGDTNSTLSGALAAVKLHIPIIHIEAGCRSFNRNMPEEINRVITDTISNILIAPDKESESNLINEGISKDNIFLLGSTTYDVVNRNIKLIDFSNIQHVFAEKNIQIQRKEYSLVTIHRAENTNSKETLSQLINALNKIAETEKLIFPIHPRTRKKIEEYSIEVSNKINLTEPLGYLEFLSLIQNAKVIFSDSGGIQEEAAALNVPCLILRNQTEWIRLVECGKNILLTNKTELIVERTEKILNNQEEINKMSKIKAPFIENTTKKIIEKIEEFSNKK